MRVHNVRAASGSAADQTPLLEAVLTQTPESMINSTDNTALKSRTQSLLTLMTISSLAFCNSVCPADSSSFNTLISDLACCSSAFSPSS